MHKATLRSPRLARVLAFLQERGGAGATTMELVHGCEVCAVNSIVAEIRANGIAVECRDEGINRAGAHVFRYVLVDVRERDLFGQVG